MTASKLVRLCLVDCRDCTKFINCVAILLTPTYDHSKNYECENDKSRRQGVNQIQFCTNIQDSIMELGVRVSGP